MAECIKTGANVYFPQYCAVLHCDVFELYAGDERVLIFNEGTDKFRFEASPNTVINFIVEYGTAEYNLWAHAQRAIVVSANATLDVGNESLQSVVQVLKGN